MERHPYPVFVKIKNKSRILDIKGKVSVPSQLKNIHRKSIIQEETVENKIILLD